MAAVRPVLLPAQSPSDFLSYALKHSSPARATTLLICSSRQVFLDSLKAAVRDAPDHHLLHATLQQIASSKSISVAYLPTISHLRAYLAVLPEPELGIFAKEGTRKPLLLVYGILGLHRHTSEWSAQGLGITMASLVESGSRCGYAIFICEEDMVSQDLDTMEAVAVNDEGALDDNDELQRRLRQRKTNHWREEMPMLNGSIRRMVAGGDEMIGWAGRTVEVGRVLQRWCVFSKGQ